MNAQLVNQPAPIRGGIGKYKHANQVDKQEHGNQQRFYKGFELFLQKRSWMLFPGPPGGWKLC